MGPDLDTWLIIALGLLSITALAAVIVFFAMLLGRKAVHHATRLSFVVSVLIHFGLLCGWFAWNLIDQKYSNTVAASELPPAPPDDVVELDAVIPETEDLPEAEESGNNPLATRIESSAPPELARLEPKIEPAPDLPEPDRQNVETPTASADIPDVASQPEIPPSIPEPQQTNTPSPTADVRVPANLDEPRPETRPEVSIPNTPLDRLPVPTISQTDTPLQRSTREGNVNVIEVEPEPARSIPDLESDPAATIERTEGTFDEIAQPTGPTKTLLDKPDFGTDADAPDETGTVGKPQNELIVRARPTTSTSGSPGSLERTRPSVRPSAGRPARPGGGPVAALPSSPSPAVASLAPDLVRPEFDKPVGAGRKLPESYRLRTNERRMDSVQRFGGTEQSEKAVEASLAWLAGHQERAGYWSAARFGAGNGPRADVAGPEWKNETAAKRETRRTSGIQADSGVTALALLCFLARGYPEEEGPYRDHVNRAINWLIGQQREDGYLGGDATYFARNYCHGMAAYALGEALCCTQNPSPRLIDAVKRAVGYTLHIQLNVDGGWRYNSSSANGDMSMFGWQLMALKSAENAGLDIPVSARTRMIKFLSDRSLGDNRGLAAYRPGEKPSPAMTAEALFCKQILGIKRSNPQSTEAVRYLSTRLPKKSGWNLYYWYYGTLAMKQYGGEYWSAWNRAVRDELVDSQRTTGDLAGSWDPIGPWGPYGGRIYSTALATLCLEVYYRYTPLYEHQGLFR